ncbi:MAG: 3-oxoadipate enol-lactonase [Burkholderiales bacterium]|nr:3-oxoadipate enol-lactonase [Burkholderiales bacterium]
MKANVNGIQIEYSVEGSGPWITLSHSLACDSSMWDPQMAVLKSRFTVLRFDTRGHGGSDAPDRPYTLEEMADDVKGLLDTLGVKQTHWMGLSMGGMIGQAFALRHPGIFKSLILADTTSRRPDNAAQMWGERIQIARTKGMAALVDGTLARWFTDPYRAAQPEVMARIGKVIAATPAAGYCGCGPAIASIDLTHRLKEIKLPALVIVGEEDMGTPVSQARAIHENLPGSELLVIPKASHLSNIEQAEIYNRAMLAFLDRVGN